MKKTATGLWDLNLSHWSLSRHSQNHMTSPVEGRKSEFPHTEFDPLCCCSTRTLFQSLKMFDQFCVKQSRRDLWHLRMRLNLCFSKLLKMSPCKETPMTTYSCKLNVRPRIWFTESNIWQTDNAQWKFNVCGLTPQKDIVEHMHCRRQNRRRQK